VQAVYTNFKEVNFLLDHAAARGKVMLPGYRPAAWSCVDVLLAAVSTAAGRTPQPDDSPRAAHTVTQRTPPDAARLGRGDGGYNDMLAA
jgi:hypothetical protein